MRIVTFLLLANYSKHIILLNPGGGARACFKGTCRSGGRPWRPSKPPEAGGVGKEGGVGGGEEGGPVGGGGYRQI